MTKELLERRLQELDKALQQALANFNMIEGGKQECLYWLEKIEKQVHAE